MISRGQNPQNSMLSGRRFHISLTVSTTRADTRFKKTTGGNTAVCEMIGRRVNSNAQISEALELEQEKAVIQGL